MIDSVRQILQSQQPGQVLCRMFAENAVPPLTFLADADGVTAGPAAYHSGSVLTHMARVMDEVAVATNGDPLAIWMAFVHDAGKLTSPKAMLPHHYGHELRGEQIAEIWGKEAMAGDIYTRAGIFAAYNHMKAGRYNLLQTRKKLRFLLDVAATGWMGQFWALASADSKSNVGQVALLHWKSISHLAEGMTSRDIPDRTRHECLKILATQVKELDP